MIVPASRHNVLLARIERIRVVILRDRRAGEEPNTTLFLGAAAGARVGRRIEREGQE
jgi:hypothetical protein